VRRIFWGLVGLGMGAAIGVGVTRWVSRTADRLAPQSLASELVQTAADWRERLAAALAAGQSAMAEREAELRAQLAEPGSGAG
jgi:ABC-type Zn2+ transport system substrate-binding protein/surface adhesin